jgi:hypothetical protein
MMDGLTLMGMIMVAGIAVSILGSLVALVVVLVAGGAGMAATGTPGRRRTTSGSVRVVGSAVARRTEGPAVHIPSGGGC